MDAAAKLVTTITLAPDLRARLDDEAARLDRSRSWLASKAIEAFLQNSNVATAVAATAPAPLGGVSSFCAMPGLPPAALDGRPPPFIEGKFFSQENLMDPTYHVKQEHYATMGDLHREKLERAAELARQRVAETQRASDDVSRQNRDSMDRLAENADIAKLHRDHERRQRENQRLQDDRAHGRVKDPDDAA